MTLDFGYSPCPNDTFMFWAWAQGVLQAELRIEPRMADIQDLNRLALGEARWALTKVSIPTYLHPDVQKNYRLLSVGAALGRGCGPLVVSRSPWSLDSPRPIRVAIPGRNTTAFQLARMSIERWVTEWVELRYDHIMPAVAAGEVDAGVIIHESRFTYSKLGLVCALDLGGWWERKTGLPLPLGVMVARRDLSQDIAERVECLLRESIQRAWNVLDGSMNDLETRSLWSYLRDNAIELDDTTIRSHIELYVNDYSLDLGKEGREALSCFEKQPQ